MQDSKWINEAVVCEWLGVSQSWLLKNRNRLGLNYSYLGNKRVLMYDRESIYRILEANSVENLIKQQTK
jgi:hypothetical protein